MRNWLVFAIIIELAIIAILSGILFLETPVPLIKIKSDSMKPVFEEGDYVVISGRSKIQEGDIIAYYNVVEGRIIVHRVIDSVDECYITKGDNSQHKDFFEPCPNHIIGEVILNT